jgi:GH15 family glucan-1,4-alpha-glucosidase
MTKLIEDYGMIGDGETAALVQRNGSIDWLCWPRFDSDACFAALLGTEEHGYWKIAPAGAYESERRYQPDTLILETDHKTGNGTARVVDFMPIRENRSVLIRIVTGLKGKVSLRNALNLKFNYGKMLPWLEVEGATAFAHAGPDIVRLQSPVELSREGSVIIADFTVNEGEELVFVLAYGDYICPPPGHIDPHEALHKTQHYWRDWIGRFTKRTDWPDAVRRSLITLKAMIYRPSGGIVAAPTTSLPEAAGGDMNWDYRFSWVRDATFTLAALINAGYHEEAIAWRDWLLRAVAGDPENMRIMYRIDGSRRLEEWIAPWLPGFRWATPVRIGNAAAVQLQLDVYGELIDAVHLAAKAGIGDPSEHGLSVQDAIVRHVESVWRMPDQGLWEARGEPRHHVYSKASAWVVMDRYVSGPLTAARLDKAELARLGALRDTMHEEICREGYDQGLGTFVNYYGCQELDASLLLLPIIGFLPANDERMAGTIAAIERDLVEDGLVRRWRPDGGTPEATFLACTCWLAECQAMQGRHEAARKTFERLLAVQNDLGLLAEEYDTRSKCQAGNFPQALSHLALVQTALSLCGPVMTRGSA